MSSCISPESSIISRFTRSHGIDGNVTSILSSSFACRSRSTTNCGLVTTELNCLHSFTSRNNVVKMHDKVISPPALVRTRTSSSVLANASSDSNVDLFMMSIVSSYVCYITVLLRMYTRHKTSFPL
ncbi:hypothetical protein WN66_00031 [Saccharomyces cerevisiae]|nr:hypothetical protein WN66_00031 [Saccharomyces cerevisiae]